MIWILVIIIVCVVLVHNASKGGEKQTKPKAASGQEQAVQKPRTKERLKMQGKGGAWVCTDRDFENRLYRARTEKFKIVQFYGENKAEADILSEGSGNTYHVGLTHCDCEDFKKGNHPCKHILYFALQTGRYDWIEKAPPADTPSTNEDGMFVPHYWDYYNEKPKWIGYTNLLPYEVSGRQIGKSEKTGKETNRKKTAYVNAASKDDAMTAAQEAGVMPPYDSVEVMDEVGSEAQYGYLRGAGIPYPRLVSRTDIGALLDRYQEDDDSVCPQYLFEMATKYRVMVSYFQSTKTVLQKIWYCLPVEKQTALYCYAVYCKETNSQFGYTKIEDDDPLFAEFEPTEKERAYITGIEDGEWIKPNRNASAYKSARQYLLQKRPWLFSSGQI